MLSILEFFADILDVMGVGDWWSDVVGPGLWEELPWWLRTSIVAGCVAFVGYALWAFLR